MSSARLTCPSCTAPVMTGLPVGTPVACPQCGTTFAVTAEVPQPLAPAPLPEVRPIRRARRRSPSSSTVCLVLAVGVGVVLAWAAISMRLARSGGGRYTIRIKHFSDPGKPALIHNTERSWTRMTYRDPRGTILRDMMAIDTREDIATETVLEEGEPRPRKYQRVYQKAVSSNGPTLSARSHQGQTLTYELRNGRYVVAEQGGSDLTREDREDLANKANDALAADLTAVFVPPGPVRVGEIWPIDPQVLAGRFGDEVELLGDWSGGETKLVRVYDSDGNRYGVLEAEVHLGLRRVRSLRFEKNAAQFQAKVTLEVAIDGSDGPWTTMVKANFMGRGVAEEGGVQTPVDVAIETMTRNQHFPGNEHPVVPEELPRASSEVVEGWREFTSQEGKYSVRFPGTPRMTIESDPRGGVWYRWAVERDRNPAIGYQVWYTDDLTGSLGVTPRQVLEAAAKRLARDTRQKKEFALAGHPGLELSALVAHKGGELTVTYRFFVINHRVYLISAPQGKGKTDAAAAARFLDSFAIADTGAAKPLFRE